MRHADNNYDLTQAYARNGGGIDPADNLVSMNSIIFDYREKQDELDLYADGPFSLFGRKHKLLVYLAWQHLQISQRGLEHTVHPLPRSPMLGAVLMPLRERLMRGVADGQVFQAQHPVDGIVQHLLRALAGHAPAPLRQCRKARRRSRSTVAREMPSCRAICGCGRPSRRLRMKTWRTRSGRPCSIWSI
ncbi:Ferric-pseudobactin BN7/BN8 receptor precursor [compost metagenome]